MSFSGTWPRWGVMRDGVCSERLTPVRPTNESASGSWPTPNKMDAADTASMCDPEHWHVRAMQKMEQGIHLQFPLRVAVQMWPAPGTGMPVATPHSQMLRETWPTPRKCAAMNAGLGVDDWGLVGWHGQVSSSHERGNITGVGVIQGASGCAT